MSFTFRTASAAFAALVLAACAHAEFTYTITDLGTLGGGDSGATGINASGQVVGYSSTSLDEITYHAFLYDGSTLRDLGTIGGIYGGNSSVAHGINDAGHVVGQSEFVYNESTGHAFRYSGSSMTDLHNYSGPLGGAISAAFDINNSGQVVGSSYLSSNIGAHAFLHNGTSMIDLGTLGGASSEATGINDAGHVVGESATTGNAFLHAFLHNGTSMTDLGTLGGNSSRATGINASGQIVGWSSLPGDVPGVEHAFLSNGTTMIDLGSLGGDTSHAFGINDSGQVVGQSIDGNGAFRAMGYNGSRIGATMIDLNTVTNLSGTHFTALYSATAINNSGQIVGYGFTPNGGRAFLLTPISGTGIPPREPVVVPSTTLNLGVELNTVSFTSQIGYLYQLQVSLDLGAVPIVWTNVGAQTAGTGTTLVLSAPPVPSSKVFYRVVID